MVVNLFSHISADSTTVYIAVKFYHATDMTRLKQYVSLIRVIESQNNTFLDFCTQIDFFVSETLLVVPEVKKLFKEVRSIQSSYFTKLI